MDVLVPADPWNVVRSLQAGNRRIRFWSLPALEAAGLVELARLPYAVRVLLENQLRHCGRGHVAEDHVRQLCSWHPDTPGNREFPFMPARVVLQDLTGVPCLVDLAAMRSAVSRAGLDPRMVNPLVPVDLVIDHSLQVDYAGRPEALDLNMDLEYQRNGERYKLFRWAQREFQNLRVTPPGIGIVHQVNLEALAPVVSVREATDGWEAFPDSVVGADSHTTMINGLGVVGWGVGGIEAEAVMLGQPYFMLPPPVVGVRLRGRLRPGVLATDLALSITALLRHVGVVGTFVEFFGPGATALSLPDRATVANMAPEYGATMGYFPVDDETLRYMLQTGRNATHVALTQTYMREQHLMRVAEAPDPDYSLVVDVDLAEVAPTLAGPRRPQDTLALDRVAPDFAKAFPLAAPDADPLPEVPQGAVAIAAITSCTNTSNPSALIAAGLLARNAVARGLRPAPWVRTSFTPGSRAVGLYLARLGLLEPLEELGFAIAGYACATCIGNAGELLPAVEQAVKRDGVTVAAVLSGNRNFEARIHPSVKANYLASPPLVVAYALAGSMQVDLSVDSLGMDTEGRPVYLADLWPNAEEIDTALSEATTPDVYVTAPSTESDRRWTALEAPAGALYPWQPSSTYLQEPPFVAGLRRSEHGAPIYPSKARILALLGDSITTDHISPAGRIGLNSPAGAYLTKRGVAPEDFNTYGSRRGNHEVLMRGTFANPRLRNAMAANHDGGFTTHHPSGDVVTIFEASERYAREGVPLVVLAGKEYGSGSSRDWAAKGPALLGVRAVIAESFERIHRSNLVGMGILPLQFLPGEGAVSLGLRGDEILSVRMPDPPEPGCRAEVTVTGGVQPEPWTFTVRSRLDSKADIEYFLSGGILPHVFRLMAGV
ncbi:MAG: Aconitate hydratase [Actinobacteria bacterium ADurb.Bin444]|nr:MAG: Aconitate hydratase [Actinobacteria bacterium ADurb.Bin444]